VIGVLRDGTVGDAPQQPQPQPTLAALPGLLEEARPAGMRLYGELRVADLAAVPDTIGRHALRIIQEALTNARKHAPSAAVDLTVKGAPGEGLTIEVRNPVHVLTPGRGDRPRGACRRRRRADALADDHPPADRPRDRRRRRRPRAACPRAARPPHRTRAGGGRRGRARQVQRRDQPRALHEHRHREGARLSHVPEKLGLNNRVQIALLAHDAGQA
jgi:hypothetical protein